MKIQEDWKLCEDKDMISSKLKDKSRNVAKHNWMPNLQKGIMDKCDRPTFRSRLNMTDYNDEIILYQVTIMN